MRKEIDVTSLKVIKILLIVFLPFVVIPYIIANSIEIDESRKLIQLAIFVVCLLLNKYPHEFCHYAVGRILGFKCRVKFGLLRSECKVFGLQSYKQLILIAIAPLLFYIPVSIVIFASNILFLYKIVFLSSFMFWLSSMVGDYVYVYYALTNRGAEFGDNGHVLVISKE